MDSVNYEDKIIELENKVAEVENSWKRALADYKNLEKRTKEDMKNVMEFSNLNLMEKLVPILDNFEMIEQHSDDMGIKLSIKDFKQTLESAGLSELKVQHGQEFNHELMDAIETIQGEKNKIMEIIRKGYLYKEKLIRPASVKVGNGQTVESVPEKEKNNE